MAWIFSLSAECGLTKSDAEAFAQHFNGYEALTSDGTTYHCSSWVSDIDGAWWAMTSPAGVSTIGIQSADDERLLTEIGFSLYERLKAAPPYRYAIVGVEVDGFRTYDELLKDASDTNTDLSGLVLSQSIWRDLGRPDVFKIFAPDFYWKPFRVAR